MTLIKDGEALDSRRYLVGDGPYVRVDGASVASAMMQGYSVVMNRVHELSPTVRNLAAQLGQELGVEVAANAYITPPGSKALELHYDHHDVIIVQVDGSKLWQTCASPVVAPTKELSWRDIDSRVADEILNSNLDLRDLRLDKGDVLYLPRGWMHRARSGESRSVHVTLSFDPQTKADFLIANVRRSALEDSAWRSESALQLGQGSEAVVAEMAELAQLVQTLNLSTVPNSAGPVEIIDPLALVDAIENPERFRFRGRNGAAWSITGDASADTFELKAGSARVQMPTALQAPTEALLGQAWMSTGDLGLPDLDVPVRDYLTALVRLGVICASKV
ncbi:JmjC domain-containing protein [Promicromonospora sp. NFX87]|uniref:JmjC domain-containing protein n=1 Tax=Promicromonospora sp. NFX87 TaxID=3402691 RepID=UPI003AFACB6B